MRISRSALLISSLAFSCAAYAAQNTTNIDLEVKHIEYLNLIGTARNITKYFSVDDIKPAGRRGPGPTVTIGTLGLESTQTGDCTLDFSTLNNFRLLHTVTNRRLTRYRLNYRNKRITRRRNRTMTVPCNFTPSNLDFTAVGRFRRNVKSGIYSDIVTIVVTTQ